MKTWCAEVTNGSLGDSGDFRDIFITAADKKKKKNFKITNVKKLNVMKFVSYRVTIVDISLFVICIEKSYTKSFTWIK